MGCAGRNHLMWSEWKNLSYLLLEDTAVSPLLIVTIALLPRLSQLGLVDTR